MGAIISSDAVKRGCKQTEPLWRPRGWHLTPLPPGAVALVGRVRPVQYRPSSCTGRIDQRQGNAPSPPAPTTNQLTNSNVPARLLLLVLSFSLGAPAWANVWKYVDANGVTQFTNQPPKNGAELVIDSGPSSARSARGEPSADLAPEAAALETVAQMHASPQYHAVQGSLTAASLSNGVDHALLKAVVVTESGFQADAVSRKGAIGLMQIMPATARRYGVKPTHDAPLKAQLVDPDVNLQTGSRYLADLLRLFGDETELALAAYNAGEGAVMRAGRRIPNYKETQQYVKKVMAVYRVLKTP